MDKIPIVLFISDNQNEIEKNDYTFQYIHLFNDHNLLDDLNKYKPNVIVSMSNSCDDCVHLSKLDYSIRKKWIHYCQLPELSILEQQVYHCFFSDIFSKSNHLISIFSTTYHSGDKILRPYNSLLQQTYTNWEWVIVDDSKDMETYQQMLEMRNNDPRIRIYKRMENSGKIGEVKNEASNLCRGEYLVELDHDDELTPNCLEEVTKAFDNNPDVGFIYTDFSELYYPSMDNFNYPENWAMGFGSYRKVYYHNKWINVANSVPINQYTLMNIVGVPNHARCWRSAVLREIGGYNVHLTIADDYHILLETFLHTKMMRLPILGYIQYKNLNEDNFSIIRNKEITKLQHLIMKYYKPRLMDRLKQLNLLVDDKNPKSLNWTRDYLDMIPTSTLLPENEDTISIVMPTYNRKEQLIRAINSVVQQKYTNWRLYIIGDNCPILNELIESLDITDNRIEWWNLETNYNDGGTTPRNYALRMLVNTKWIAYLDDDNYWNINHLESLMSHLIFKPTAKYGFSSFIIDETTPIIAKIPILYRIDTSSIIHQKQLLDKYGYWRTREEAGYSHDWELVSRWSNESYIKTEEITMHYDSNNEKNCNPLQIYNYYK